MNGLFPEDYLHTIISKVEEYEEKDYLIEPKNKLVKSDGTNQKAELSAA